MKTALGYRQCVLKKGDKTEISYIPSKFAILHKVLKINEDNGWRVDQVGSVELNSDEVLDASQLYKKTRKESDI